MADFMRNNLINITSTNFATSSDLDVNGILVVASADTWSCILKDRSGAVCFRADSSITNHRTFYVPLNGQPLTGLQADTLTNIEIVVVYLNK